MAPTLLPGDWVLVVTPASYRRGDVVVVEHPGRPGYEMVKRLVAVPGDVVAERRLAGDEYWVEGDGPASTDSRHFGPVTRDALRARAELVYRPRERWGRVR
jgi:mitochondrial inner membrane protease subunit 1